MVFFNYVNILLVSLIYIPVAQNESRQLLILRATKFIAYTYYVPFFNLKHLYILVHSLTNKRLLLLLLLMLWGKIIVIK